jgi:hypothetical protein
MPYIQHDVQVKTLKLPMSRTPFKDEGTNYLRRVKSTDVLTLVQLRNTDKALNFIGESPSWPGHRAVDGWYHGEVQTHCQPFCLEANYSCAPAYRRET